jgi:hypothetical protein
VSQIHYRFFSLSALFEPEHHQAGAFVNVPLGFQEVSQRIHMADDPSSFAMGLVIGLSEGTKLSIQ